MHIVILSHYIKLIFQTLQTLFCNTALHRPDYRNTKENALSGSLRLSQLWNVKELKVHFINPEVLVNSKYGDYKGFDLNPPQILEWVQLWNDHAEYYPTISLVPSKEKDQAHIRVELDSRELLMFKRMVNR